jgi:hypothetical protein
LGAADATAPLSQLVGARVAAEPAAATMLVARCLGLPLALRIVAEVAASRSATPLSAICDHCWADGGSSGWGGRSVSSDAGEGDGHKLLQLAETQQAGCSMNAPS